MATYKSPAAIELAGKASDIEVVNCVVVGSGILKGTETSDISGVSVRGTLNFDSPATFLACLGLPAGIDASRVADIIERTAADPRKEVSQSDRTWLAAALGSAANLVTVVQGLAAAAAHPAVQAMVIGLRRMAGL